jgi:hypothetical protein
MPTEGLPSALNALTEAPRAGLVRIDHGLPRRGEWRNGFDLVDFDGDGHLDVVHGPKRRAPGSPPEVFLGDGRGRFEVLARRFPALAYDYGDAAAADFDGDGALDLALASHRSGLLVLARRGAEFKPWGPPLGVIGPSWLGSFTSRSLAAADWNGDGKADLVTLYEGPDHDARRRREGLGGPRVLLLAGDGAQILAPTSPMEEFGDSLAVADVDGDGQLEIIAAAGILGSKRVLYRHGERGLVAASLDALPDHASVRAVAVGRGAPAAVFVAGLDHGAAQPAAFVQRLVFEDGGFRGRLVHHAAGDSEPRALAAADFDGDGAEDLAVGQADGTIRLFLGPALTLAVAAPAEPWRRGCSARHIEAGDVVPGGGLELVVSFAASPSPERCPSGGGLTVYRIAR